VPASIFAVKHRAVMIRPSFLAALALSLFGCNTAQITEAPVQDDGGAQCITGVSVPLCDAGGVTVGCVADPDAGFAAVRSVAPGQTIPYGCEVQLSEVEETPQVQCTIFSECRCQAPDASADGGAGTGTWSCSTAR
jgi:hypothetical protein